MDKKNVPVSGTGTRTVSIHDMDSLSQGHTSEQLTRVASDLFADVDMDVWVNENHELFMTGEQIGRALEYSDPVRSIAKVFDRNLERLLPNSTVVRLTTIDGRERDVRVFNEKGIYEIIRKSGQPKADEFYDWVYGVLRQIRITGSYSVPSAPTTQQPVDERHVRTELLKAALEHEERLITLEERISTVERNVTLTHGEQRALQRAIGRRVYELATPADRSEFFRQLYREIRDRWGVASYRDVRRIELQEVLNYVRAWKPRMQLVG